MNKFVPDRLRAAAGIYEERNKLYGDNYHKFGEWALPLLRGIRIETAHDVNRLAMFINILNKIGRYAEQFNSGGHADSLDDLAVYAMMMQELDA